MLEKHAFSLKNGLAMCYFWSHISKQWQLIITLLVSICARGINEQLQKTSCADVLSSRKKICKTLGGGGWQPPLTSPPLYVRGLISKGEKIKFFQNLAGSNPRAPFLLSNKFKHSLCLFVYSCNI